MAKRPTFTVDIYESPDGKLSTDVRGVIDQLKSNVENGEDAGAIEAVRWLIMARLQIPDWAAIPFLHATMRVSCGEASWNDVFGRPRTKGLYERELRDFQLAAEICRAVEPHAGHINEGVFETIATREWEHHVGPPQ